LNFSTHDKRYILNVPRETIVKSAGYDTMEQLFEKADTYWLGEIYEYYSRKPEWEKKREEERQAELRLLEARKAEVRRQTPKEEAVK